MGGGGQETYIQIQKKRGKTKINPSAQRKTPNKDTCLDPNNKESDNNKRPMSEEKLNTKEVMLEINMKGSTNLPLY